MSRQENSDSSSGSDSFSSGDGTQVVPDFLIEPAVKSESRNENTAIVVVTSQSSNPNSFYRLRDPPTTTLLRQSLESARKPSNNTVSVVTSNDMEVHQEPSSKMRKIDGTPQMTTNEAALLLASLGQGQGTDEQANPSQLIVAKKSSSDVKLPVNSVQELDNLEMLIEENEKLKAKLLKRLGTIGGKNFGQCVRNALKALMTDAVAVQLNWAGRGGKKPFQSYEIKSVLFDAVRMSFPQVTDFQLKDPVQCWLKRSRNYQPKEIRKMKD